MHFLLFQLCFEKYVSQVPEDLSSFGKVLLDFEIKLTFSHPLHHCSSIYTGGRKWQTAANKH